MIINNRLFLYTLGLMCLGMGSLRADAPPADGLFKAYETNFAQGPDPTVDVNGIPNAAHQVTTAKTADGEQVEVRDVGVWRGFYPVGSLGQWPGYATLNGGERLHVTYTYSAAAVGSTSLIIQYYGGAGFQIAGGNELTADGKTHTLDFTLPLDAKTQHIVSLWLRLDNPGPGKATFLLQKFTWDRPRINNRIDADRILQTPPLHVAKVTPIEGQMAMVVDGKPISGLGWASILNNTTGDPELHDITGASGFRLTRLVFTLGDSLLALYPPSWLGPDQFDFSFLDQQMARIQKANPDAKVILDVALDRAKWWVWMHPNAAGAGYHEGVEDYFITPDYLSTEWRRDSRDAIRQMVAHVQTSPYRDAVIGYQLFNGESMDCNFEVDVSTPPAVARYHAFLRAKYKDDAGLKAAWHDPRATIAAARADILPADVQRAYSSPGAFPLLTEPYRDPELLDKTAFLNHSYQQIIENFCRDIKEATQGRALTGARTGNLLGGVWDWPTPVNSGRSISGRMTFQPPMAELLNSPDFDIFEVQEPYVGRGIGDYGSGTPIDPPQGLMAHNKLLMIQNDVRTFLSAPGEGYGRTPDLPTTLQMQRRIFANSLTHGMTEYLWQMSYHYTDPSMLADFRKMEQIELKSFHAPRDTGAQIAFVYDQNYRNYLGYDPLKDAPSRGFALFDYAKFPWARAGVPYDMIFLDQLPKAKPYKVYVFVHTVGLTDAQRAMIKQVTRRDGRVSLFIWADGAIDGQRINLAKMSDLVGMKLEMSSKLSPWKMSPTPWFREKAGVSADYPMGTLAIQEPSEPDAANDPFAPSFSVTDPDARPLAVYDPGSPLAGATGVAVKGSPNYTSIYSASAILPPTLLRYALAKAEVFSYTDTADSCYIDKSFLGLNIQQTPGPHVVHVHLPQATGLYEVFRDEELPASDHFDIAAEPGQTYLYFRGSKAQWEALGQ